MSRSPRELPKAPRSLDAAAAADLIARTDAALRVQRHALAESIDRALGHIPFPLRIPVRKVLGL
jgi:hypothetical protein